MLKVLHGGKNAPLITGANFLHSRKIKNFDIVIGANVNYDHGYIGPPVVDTNFITDTISNFSESQMSSKRARMNFNLRYRSKKLKGLNYGINGNVMFSQSNMAFAWLGDSTNLYRGYPGAVFLRDQFIFNIDPYVNFFTKASGKHSLRSRVLYSDSKMTAGQSSKAQTYYADYMFKKRYKNLNNLDFYWWINRDVHKFVCCALRRRRKSK